MRLLPLLVFGGCVGALLVVVAHDNSKVSKRRGKKNEQRGGLLQANFSVDSTSNAHELTAARRPPLQTQTPRSTAATRWRRRRRLPNKGEIGMRPARWPEKRARSIAATQRRRRALREQSSGRATSAARKPWRIERTDDRPRPLRRRSGRLHAAAPHICPTRFDAITQGDNRRVSLLVARISIVSAHNQRTYAFGGEHVYETWLDAVGLQQRVAYKINGKFAVEHFDDNRKITPFIFCRAFCRWPASRKRRTYESSQRRHGAFRSALRLSLSLGSPQKRVLRSSIKSFICISQRSLNVVCSLQNKVRSR